jgi:hypothetical protein
VSLRTEWRFRGKSGHHSDVCQCPHPAGDLIDKLDVLRVAFSECDRAGRYRLDRLIKDHGHEAKIVDWLDEITADCSKKSAQNWNDQCAARCPDLPKIL